MLLMTIEETSLKASVGGDHKSDSSDSIYLDSWLPGIQIRFDDSYLFLMNYS